MSITSLVSGAFKGRQADIEAYAHNSEEIQRRVLAHLVQQGQHTQYGNTWGMNDIQTYEHFAKQLPVTSYEELKEPIDRMRHGEADVLWPGVVKWYAKSSGTTNDKSKFIPVSAEGLKNIHYKGGKDAVALYLRNNPKSGLFDGRSLILGGSHAANYNVAHSLVGDLSAILIENINPLANIVRVPKKSIALMPDFEAKREAIAQQTLHANVTNISGVPSWMLSVLVRVLELSGKDRRGVAQPRSILSWRHCFRSLSRAIPQVSGLVADAVHGNLQRQRRLFRSTRRSRRRGYAAHDRLRRVLRVHSDGRIWNRQCLGGSALGRCAWP